MRLSFLILFFLSFSLQAQDIPLSITCSGIEEVKGKLMLRISNEKGEVVLQKLAPVKRANRQTVKLYLPAGSYAIACFHDENDNDKLDRSFSGFPTEVYGFSNDARGMFGPPDLEDQLFEHRKKQSIRIQLK